MSSYPGTINHIREPERERELSDVEELLYDLFAKSYLIDGDPEAAALRLGIHKFVARERAREMMNHGFTRRRLTHLMSREISEQERSHIGNRAIRVMAQELYNYESKNRIAAALNIHKIFQAQQLNGGLGNDADDSGVMVIPALFQSAEEWEDGAKASQAALKLSVRD